MKTKKPIRILVSSGGTAGHVYPTLEVLELLSKRHSLNILYVGSANSIEEKLVGKRYPFVAIPVGKLRRYPSWLTIRDASRVARGIIRARKIVKEFMPDLIFVKGGYVSLPIVAAASRTKIPVVAHESDIVIGMANRFAARIASKVCVGFPIKYYSKSLRPKLVFSGVPIRKGFFQLARTSDRQQFSIRKDMPVLLITGATQGSLAINKTFESIVLPLLGRVQIIHLTGRIHEQHFLAFKNNLPKTLRANYHPFGYIEKGMESIVRISDLVVSRAGSSIAEFAAAGLPMILIPLPYTGGDHQLKNSEYYTKEGAAITIRQQQLTSQRLLDTIHALLDDKHRLKGLSIQAKKLSIPDATDKVVRIIEDTLRSQSI